MGSWKQVNVLGKNADARMGWDLKRSACYLGDSHSPRK